MGIRIKKVLGYGLEDVATEDGSITDERINPDSPLLDGSFSLESYRQFLESKTHYAADMEKSLIDSGETNERDLRRVCSWDPEYGLPNVIVIQPLLCVGKWTRYGDMIDAEEHFLLHGPSDEPTVKGIKHGLYPYTGYMDRVTGEQVGDQVLLWRRLLNAKVSKPILDRVSQALGYRSTAEALDRIVPLVPEEVQHLVEWGQLFRNADVWKQLRPALYTLFS